MKPIAALACTLLLALPSPAQDPDAKTAAADAKARADELKSALRGQETDPKLAAIEACGDLPHAITAAAVAPLVADKSEEIAIAAVKALGRMKDLAEAAKALHASLKPNESRSKVLAAAFDAIGEVNHPSSVPVCKDWVDSRIARRDGSLQRGIDEAIACLGSLKWKSSVSALIDLGKRNIVAGPGYGLRYRSDNRFNRALRRLTGEDFEDIDSWDDWWKKAGAKFNDDLSAK
jgi:hypothetical protein